MLKTRIMALVAVLVLAIAAMGVSAQDDPGTIVDVAAGNEDFSILVDLVTAAGLADTLADAEASFTVFAPTNDAFMALPAYVRDYVVANPDLLTQVLLYHVVDGAVTSDMITEDMMATSMDMGNELTVTVSDMGIMVDQANVVAADVTASNGVIHVIDSVLVPPITLPTVIPADVNGDIVTAGSSTVGPLTIAVADEFSAEGYTGEISVAITGSGAGFERFCESGETDLSNASRAIREGEVESCNEIDREPIEFRVGTDAIAIVVNPSNDFAGNLSSEELAAAFSTAETWADINPEWPDEPILRFAPGSDSGTYDYFVEEILGEDETLIQGASNIQFSEDDNVLVEGVANNPFAIGFFGFAYYADNQDSLSLTSIDEIPATPANVDANTYLLARPLFVYSDAQILTEKPQVAEFISYYLQNVNRLLISDVTAEAATVTDEEGNILEYDVSVAYFGANPFGLNIARLLILPFVGMDSGM